MEQTLTPEESLQIIQKSISNSRRNMREGSFFFILWGWALVLGAAVNYTLLIYGFRSENYDHLWWKHLIIWLAFVALAMVIQYVKIAREGRASGVKTHVDRYITVLWTASGAIYALMVFFCILLETIPVPFILAITALATFVSGIMIRFRPVVIGGIVFFLAAVISIFLAGMHQLLVFILAMILGYLIPGYMLRSIKNGDHV